MLQGCSDKQKEAERLEQEMRDREAADSGTPTEMTDDSLAAALAADAAAAVPQEPQTTIKPAMPAAPAGTGYTVQIASCEDEDYARYLVDRYTGRGYEPFVTTITYNNQTYYRVRIGNFANYSEATALRDALVDKYSVRAIWIDRLDQ
jgi:cell division septation protein DedD